MIIRAIAILGLLASLASHAAEPSATSTETPKDKATSCGMVGTVNTCVP